MSAAKPPRYSREEGSERLLTAAIDLARTTPISKITVREIAAGAGLQTMHVKRYFGSRNELLVAVSNRLMASIVESVESVPLEKLSAVITDNEDVNLRLRIVSHLLDEGTPASAFADDQSIYMRIAERIAAVNQVGGRTARTYAHIIQLVLQGSRLMGDVNGLSTQERGDILTLLAAMGPVLSPTEQALGW